MPDLGEVKFEFDDSRWIMFEEADKTAHTCRLTDLQEVSISDFREKCYVRLFGDKIVLPHDQALRVWSLWLKAG